MSNKKELTELLTIKEAAQILKVHEETLRRWDNTGKLVAVKINKRGDRRYRKEDLLKLIENKHGK